MLRLRARRLAEVPTSPVPTPFWAAGFSFSAGAYHSDPCPYVWPCNGPSKMCPTAPRVPRPHVSHGPMCATAPRVPRPHVSHGPMCPTSPQARSFARCRMTRTCPSSSLVRRSRWRYLLLVVIVVLLVVVVVVVVVAFSLTPWPVIRCACGHVDGTCTRLTSTWSSTCGIGVTDRLSGRLKGMLS